MKKRIGRRFVSLLLTFVTILTMLSAITLPARAATSGNVTGLDDKRIGLSFTGSAGENYDPWKATDAQIIGNAKPKKNWAGKLFSKESTLTIKNTTSIPVTLSFNYAIVLQNGGTIKVDGISYTEGGTFSKELARGGSIEVYIMSGTETTDATTITMTNVRLVADTNATVTFQPAKNGSYTVNDNPINEPCTYTQNAQNAYRVKAKPAKGYRFLGWYNVTEGMYLNTASETALNIESNCTITARFASEASALFETKGHSFDNLNEAVETAQRTQSQLITLVNSGTITESYTIPAGITLLIPFDEAKTLYKETPTATHETPEPKAKSFRTLTMAAGSSITLENGAALSVGGQYFAAHGGSKGKMVGPYGHIKMESGSAITVQSGGALYAWGFISGSGSGSGAVTVESGGTVYEWYQVLDFRGGTATSEMIHSVFPFNQYAVQNVEVPLTLHTGATETAYAAIYAGDSVNTASVPFIGSNGLFNLTSGSLTKAYDGSTDRMIYTIDGEAQLNSLILNLANLSVNSEDYVLPLTNNMTVNLMSGSKLTVNQTVALLPGVEVTIGRDAELVLSKKKDMYIYDKDQWGSFCGTGKEEFIPVPNVPGRTGKRAPLADAKIDVNGTLTAEGGRTGTPGLYVYHGIYTTASGANICSSDGTGRYVQHGTASSDSNTYQYEFTGGKVFKVKEFKIPVTAAKLKNADGADKPYTETKDAKAGDTFTYCTCPTCGGGKWTNTNSLQVAAIINGNGEQVKTCATLQAAVNEFSQTSNGSTYIKMLHNTTEDIKNITKDIYLDLNGRTVTGDISVTNGYKLYGMDSSAGTGYVTAPSGKIVGKVTGTVAPVFEKPLTGDAEYNYLRYVAIKNEEGTEYTFHRFNISVTGYRFELAAPQCALFFIGKFQGDKAAKDYLKSLGFTLTGTNGTEFKNNPEISKALEEGYVEEEGGGAYLFELYLKRSFEKNPPDIAYTEEFSATAQATFKNGGTQDSGTKDNEPQHLSFKEAWQNALSAPDTDKNKKILQNFLDEFGIKIQVE